MNLTIKELAELAHKTEPDKKWLTSNDSVFYEAPGTYDYDNVYFSPSLTGEDWQVAQACRVIVAAMNLPGNLAMHKLETSKGTYYQFIRKGVPELLQEDLLQAAISALLGKEQS